MRRPQTHGDDIRALGMLKGKKHLAKHCIPSAEECLPCHSGDVFPRRSCGRGRWFGNVLKRCPVPGLPVHQRNGFGATENLTRCDIW